MKRSTLPRALAALGLCLLMLLPAGCEKKAPPDGGETQTAGPAPTLPPEEKPDPGKILSDAADVTLSDLEARLDASPLPALFALLEAEALTADVDVGFPDESGELALTVAGTVVYDSAGRRAGADLVLRIPSGEGDGAELPLSLYYGPDFVGVASEKLGQPGLYYGLVPQDLKGQLAGSAIAKLLELDDDALDEAQAALDEAGAIPALTAPGLVNSARSVLKDAAQNAELTLSESNGGTVITAALTGEEAGALLEDLAALLPPALASSPVDGGEDLSARFAALSEGAGDAVLTFTLKDGRVETVALEDDGPLFTLSLYGQSGAELALTVESLLNVSLDLASGVELHAAQGSETPTITGLMWEPDGALNYNSYTMDITDFALEGTASVEDGTARFDGIWYRGERGDRNPLTLTLTQGGTVASPAETKNAGTLTEADLARLTLKLMFELQ